MAAIEDDSTNGHIGVFDASGRLVWARNLPSYTLMLNDPATDSTGHLFINYNPGRYNGVVVLDPVDGGFNYFDSLPEREDDYAGRFYFGEVVDVGTDDVFEIIVFANDCQPTCARGTTTSVAYAWDGVDYVQIAQ